jgi:hypothetical protein
MQYVDTVKVQINCKVLLVLDISTYNKSINEFLYILFNFLFIFNSLWIDIPGSIVKKNRVEW